MNSTETRLQDALAAVGEIVGPGDVRELALPARRRLPGPRWLVFGAAAAGLAVAVALGPLGGSPVASRPDPSAYANLSVFLCVPPSSNPGCHHTDATQRQKAAILAALRGFPGVRTVAYESKAQALAVFRAKFKDRPGLLAGTPPGAIPDSYRVRLQAPAEPLRIARAVRALPGVDQVVITEPHDHRKRLVADPSATKIETDVRDRAGRPLAVPRVPPVRVLPDRPVARA
ncbi:permease-like cell division protein FtsX [Actinomadura scrupuli]|uniref:permease-like cell division protein FtsX n=1 Tax=Actinomadura scrupuli TaxID=559629 RepID=UPI003D967A5E